MKRKFKMVLDVILLLMALTLFSKRFISMQYHETAGLIFIVLVLVHIGINFKTLSAMCRKFQKMPKTVKCGTAVDLLLILCFIWLAVSGVLSSHTILTNISSDNTIFKLSHMFAGGLAVVLLGVHIGLHICKKQLPKAAAAVVSAVVLGCGIYGFVNSGEMQWLALPAKMVQTADAGAGSGTPRTQENEQQPAGEDEHRQNGSGRGAGAGTGAGAGAGTGARAGTGAGAGTGMGAGRAPLAPAEKVQNVIMFSGMILSFTVLTYWIAVPKRV